MLKDGISVEKLISGSKNTRDVISSSIHINFELQHEHKIPVNQVKMVGTFFHEGPHFFERRC